MEVLTSSVSTRSAATLVLSKFSIYATSSYLLMNCKYIPDWNWDWNRIGRRQTNRKRKISWISCTSGSSARKSSSASCRRRVIRVNDQLNGYSIDRKMFEATGWSFKDGPPRINADYWFETLYLVASPLWKENSRVPSLRRQNCQFSNDFLSTRRLNGWR